MANQLLDDDKAEKKCVRCQELTSKEFNRTSLRNPHVEFRFGDYVLSAKFLYGFSALQILLALAMVSFFLIIGKCSDQFSLSNYPEWAFFVALLTPFGLMLVGIEGIEVSALQSTEGSGDVSAVHNTCGDAVVSNGPVVYRGLSYLTALVGSVSLPFLLNAISWEDQQDEGSPKGARVAYFVYLILAAILTSLFAWFAMYLDVRTHQISKMSPFVRFTLWAESLGPKIREAFNPSERIVNEYTPLL